MPFKAGFRYNREYLGLIQEVGASHLIMKFKDSLSETNETFIENLLDGTSKCVLMKKQFFYSE